MLDVIGILLMFERKDDDQSLSNSQSEYIIQNADGLDLSPDTLKQRSYFKKITVHFKSQALKFVLGRNFFALNYEGGLI